MTTQGLRFLPHCDPRITWCSAVLRTSLPIEWLVRLNILSEALPVKSTGSGLWWKMMIPPFCEWSRVMSPILSLEAEREEGSKMVSLQKHFLISLSNHQWVLLLEINNKVVDSLCTINYNNENYRRRTTDICWDVPKVETRAVEGPMVESYDCLLGF